jgi:hypothetical protein
MFSRRNSRILSSFVYWPDKGFARVLGYHLGITWKHAKKHSTVCSKKIQLKSGRQNNTLSFVKCPCTKIETIDFHSTILYVKKEVNLAKRQNTFFNRQRTRGYVRQSLVNFRQKCTRKQIKPPHRLCLLTRKGLHLMDVLPLFKKWEIAYTKILNWQPNTPRAN